MTAVEVALMVAGASVVLAVAALQWLSSVRAGNASIVGLVSVVGIVAYVVGMLVSSGIAEWRAGAAAQDKREEEDDEEEDDEQ